LLFTVFIPEYKGTSILTYTNQVCLRFSFRENLEGKKETEYSAKLKDGLSTRAHGAHPAHVHLESRILHMPIWNLLRERQSLRINSLVFSV
jgi:hypothetical protein